ncbi:MAG: hypothetical protein QM599_05410 [Pseudoxanthomonas sp.]
MHARRLIFISLFAALCACSRTSPSGDPATQAAPDAAVQAELARLKAEGPLPAAREASVLEFWLHYKLMQATGMEQALGGEEQAVATLKAMGTGFEHALTGTQEQAARMIPAAFDGNGLDMGVMGAGYGLIGGAIGSGMLGAMSQSPEQLAAAIKNGPIKFDGKDGAAEFNIGQDGMDTTMEQTINEDGVTGKVKTTIHMDACPDAEGKLEVTIETQSQMSGGGKSGSVTLRYRQERYLDDDAHLLPLAEGDKMQGSEFFQVDMKGSGANGELSYYEDGGTDRNGKATGGTMRESGHSIFRPDEARHTSKLVTGTQNVMRAFAEMMLSGVLPGASAPWESGRCVDLKLRSSPEKRKGAQPKTHYTVFAEPRAKKDGAPTGGTVKATLNGPHSLSPQDKVKADAQFDYENPQEKDQSASIEFEARSKRGVGKATLEFDTKKGGYRIVATGGCAEPTTVCDISQPFTHTICGGQFTFAHTPTSDRSGNFTFRYNNGKGHVDAKGTYALKGPEEEMTGIYTYSKFCGSAAGMRACIPPATFGVFKFTKIDDCGE